MRIKFYILVPLDPSLLDKLSQVEYHQSLHLLLHERPAKKDMHKTLPGDKPLLLNCCQIE